MKRPTQLALAVMLCSAGAQAQLNLNGHFYGQDAFRYSQNQSAMSARSLGVGGGGAALGGDISNAFMNPAGLGFFNRNEFSISPMFIGQNSSSSYLGSTTDQTQNQTRIGQAALVLSNPGIGTRRKRSAFAIGYNRLADFGGDFRYQGTNQRSSIIDFFAQKVTEENVAPGVLDSEFNTNTGLAETASSMYYQAYLIDPLNDNNVYVASETSAPVQQNGRVRQNGGIGQTTISYGANFDDQLYVGASLGLLRLNYTSFSDHQEQFPNAEVLRGLTFGDDLQVAGSGVNLTIGAIYKFGKIGQLGVDVTTPSSMRVRETYISRVSINPVPGVIDTRFTSIETIPSDFDYRLTTPWRANVGGLIFLPKKLGFLHANVGYVGYQGLRVQDRNSENWTNLQNRRIEDRYQDVLNVQGGAEVRIGIGRLRAGYQYLANADRLGLSTTQNNITLGAGIRSQKFYADLGAILGQTTFGYTPYELQNAADFASVSTNRSFNRIMFTLGFNF